MPDPTRRPGGSDSIPFLLLGKSRNWLELTTSEFTSRCRQHGGAPDDTMLPLPGCNMATHAYRQTLKYEVARELLNARIADLTEQITIEEAKPSPDARVIEQLETAMADIGTSISQLDVTNEAGLDAAIEANRRAGEAGD